MSKILITGGAGFIGVALATRLANNNNHQVTLVDNLSRGVLDSDLETLLESENVTLVQGDLTDVAFVASLGNDYDYIYHFAAVIGVQNVANNPERVLHVNAVTTLNMIEHAKSQKHLERFVFSSTSEVYAGTLKQGMLPVPTPEDIVLCLDDINSERSTYALSKIYGESIVTNNGKKFEIPYTILRYHNVYGPRMGYQHVIPELILKISKSDVLDIYSPTHTRAFCYVDDAVTATILSAERGETLNQVVNVGNSDEEISINDLANKICHVLSKTIPINKLSDTPGSPARRCPDVSKLSKLTGYAPKVSLLDGIEKTSKWYLERAST